jgi:alpha-D-ribose 1-methylphosphonate 5-triphosphate synthase subunit PhnG
VERAGRHAASDALSDQLASTQELFTRQLQFQRELLEQLRALRGGTGNRFANGERDVSTRE